RGKNCPARGAPAGRVPRPGPGPRLATVWRCSQLEDGRRLLRHQVDRRLEGLILSELVLGDELGQHPSIDAAGGVVTGWDRAKRAGIVDEARGAREARRL